MSTGNNLKNYTVNINLTKTYRRFQILQTIVDKLTLKTLDAYLKKIYIMDEN